MDKGEWLKQGFYLKPAENGSFVLHSQNVEVGTMGLTIGFSNVDDLIEFMKSERKGLLSEKQPEMEK